MQACSSFLQPSGAALLNWAVRAMDVILHIGAHRTGTTSFQDYMHRMTPELEARNIAFRGPKWAGSAGFGASEQEITGHRAYNVDAGLGRSFDALEDAGTKTLVVSDADLLGTIQTNIEKASIYADASARLGRLSRVFTQRVTRIMLSVRSLDTFWNSSLAYGVALGAGLPDRPTLDNIANGSRSWRDVVSDVSKAFPDAKIVVLPFEQYRGRSDAFLMQGAEITAPFDDERKRLNASADLPALRRLLEEQGQSSSVLPFGMGRWNPFANEHLAALREMQADDMMWLTAGADGLATLIEEGSRDRAGKNLPHGPKRKGQPDEFKKREVARPG